MHSRTRLDDRSPQSSAQTPPESLEVPRLCTNDALRGSCLPAGYHLPRIELGYRLPLQQLTHLSTEQATQEPGTWLATTMSLATYQKARFSAMFMHREFLFPDPAVQLPTAAISAGPGWCLSFFQKVKHRPLPCRLTSNAGTSALLFAHLLQPRNHVRLRPLCAFESMPVFAAWSDTRWTAERQLFCLPFYPPGRRQSSTDTNDARLHT